MFQRPSEVGGCCRVCMLVRVAFACAHFAIMSCTLAVSASMDGWVASLVLTWSYLVSLGATDSYVISLPGFQLEPAAWDK